VATGTYGANQFKATVAYPYLIFLDNASQMWALYCLLLVYMNTHRVLAASSPALKFLCVKGVVFATFWQGVLLSLLTYFDVIASLHDTWSSACAFRQEVVVDALQDFLICVEMLLFAALHAYAFPSREYRDANLPKRAAGARLKHLFDVRDVVEDVTRHAEGVTRDLAASVQHAAGGVLHAAEGVAGSVAGGMRRGASAAGLASSWPAGGGGAAGGLGGGKAELRQPLLDGAFWACLHCISAPHALPMPCALTRARMCLVVAALLPPACCMVTLAVRAAEFDDGDLAEAPWLRLEPGAQPPRLPLPQPLAGRPESRGSVSDAGDGGDAASLL
jgi:hypothetical protein